MQLIAISNLHLRDPDASANGAEHAAQIARYLDRAAGICPSAVCYIVAGDLADAGDPVLDRIKLASPDSLARLLAKHKTVRQILFGQVLRTVFLTWNGIACIGIGRLGDVAAAPSPAEGLVFGVLPPDEEGLSVTVCPLVR